MEIILNVPSEVKQCKIYGIFSEKCKTDSDLKSKVDVFLDYITPLLNVINSGIFKNYTLHNSNHSKKVLYIAGEIINDRILNHLGKLELAIIILSSFLHDAGMFVSEDEKKKIQNTSEYNDILQDWPQMKNEILKMQNQLKQTDIQSEINMLAFRLYELHEAIACEYFRPIHATEKRYKEIIKILKNTSGRHDLLTYKDSSFEDILVSICESHNISTKMLMGVDENFSDIYQRDLHISGETVNIQFCASILRIADVLDFDRERTPKILFENLGIKYNNIPNGEISIKEWNKHLSIHTIEIKDNEIIIASDSNHPIIEQSIREFCLTIEREINDIKYILERNEKRIADNYQLTIPSNVTPKIRSIGYVFKNISFRLNQSTIIKLLMGNELYSKKVAGIRELVQNSLDACNAKTMCTDEVYSPHINITCEIDSGTNEQWLVVEDNGIGMDEYVLDKFFFTIGSSYYSTSEFTKTIKKHNGTIISRFGIGVASVFLLGEELEIITKNKHSIRNDTKQRILKVDSKGGLAFITENNGGLQGTTIRVKLSPDLIKEKFWFQAKEFITGNIIRPNLNINVDIPNFKTQITSNSYYIIENNDYIKSMNLVPMIIHLDDIDQNLKGNIFIFFSYDGKQYYFDQKLVQIKRWMYPIFGTKIYSNQLTIDGFKIQIRSSFKLFGKKKIPIVFDVNVVNDEMVSYNVSREKLTSKGTLYLKKKLKRIVIDQVVVSDFYMNLKPENRDIFYIQTKEKDNTDTNINAYYKPVLLKNLDEGILKEIKEILKTKKFFPGIHKNIAKLLGISNTQAYKYITLLIQEQNQKEEFEKAINK